MRLDGLTEHQIALLDMMWECETPRELIELRETLTQSEQKTMDVLIHLVHMETVEPEILAMKEFPMVQMLLEKIKNGKYTQYFECGARARSPSPLSLCGFGTSPWSDPPRIQLRWLDPPRSYCILCFTYGCVAQLDRATDF